MPRNPFRLMRALCNALSMGRRAKPKFVSGGRVWLTPLLLGPACALALDIGEIQVHSALNQLFDARIPLPALTPEELGKVSVKLAPAPMFKEFDLDRALALTNLVFSVEYNAEGQVYVKVVSTKPIQEPSLGLLVEFSWPRGKTFREFTVFLDPVQRLAQRPSDRSKTVLNTPAAPSAPPVEPAPRPEPALATVATRPEPEPDARRDTGGGPVAERAAVTTAPEPAQASVAAPAPLPAEAPSAPVRFYRPGDTYGPVADGEGLWGIALKVRPDPGITREQMMQALFQANPHAFSKAGISGLKTGAMLRLPSFREIADLTGSAAARQLAGVDSATAATVAPPSPAPAATEAKTAQAVTNTPEVFPLEPPVPLEPTVVMEAPAAPIPQAAPPVAAAPAPLPPAPEAVAAASGAAQSEPEMVTKASEPVAPAPEPAAEPESKMAEGAAPPAAVLAESTQEVIPEPVSVTPLLFLAVSEMVAAVAQPPAMTVSEAATGMPEPAQATSPAPEASAVASGVEPSAPVSTAAPEPPAISMDTTALLAAVEKHSPHMEQDSPLGMYLVSDVTVPMNAVFAESLPVPAPALPAGAVVAAAAAAAETSTPAVLDSPPPVAASPAEPPAKAAEPSPPGYKGGDSYGPVAPNERLWDIATKVRPDPAIGKEHMMKALFKANPRAFSKASNMDSLKIGATLRIPTLQEIVDYTGSKAASQLLKQQQTAGAAPAPVPETAAPATPAAPAPVPAAETTPAPATEPPPVAEPAAPAPPPAAETTPAPAAAPPPVAEPAAETASAPAATPESTAPPPPPAEAAPAPEPAATPPTPAAEAAPAPPLEPPTTPSTPPVSESSAPVAEKPPAAGETPSNK